MHYVIEGQETDRQRYNVNLQLRKTYSVDRKINNDTGK